MTQFRKLDINDLLCGLGGATHGVENSQYGRVQVGLNHSEHAIAINKANHPHVDFMIKDLYKAKDLAKCHGVIAGIECTNHSNAKGGESRDADSRAMANEMFRYSVETGCKFMIFENVVEFKEWGPLIKKRDKNGKIVYKKRKAVMIPHPTIKEKKIKKRDENGRIVYGKKVPVMIPDPAKKGRLFHKWKYKMINQYGFENYSERILCAADYGAATTRKRLFMIFAKKGWNIEWPEPTHSKEGSEGLFGLKKWVPCKEFIDLNNHGKSIFGRFTKSGKHNPLVENTHKRIAYGIKKYGLDQHIIKYYGTNNASSTSDPLHTVRTKDCHALISTDHIYIQNYHNSPAAGDVDSPLKTIVTKDEKAFITMEKVQFVEKHMSNKYNVSDLNKPLDTILTEPKMALTSVDLIISEFNRPTAVRSLNDPMSTITTWQGKRKINVQFMASSYTRKTPTVRSIEDPLRTITTFQSPQLVTSELIQFARNHFNQDVVQVLSDVDGNPIGVHIGNGIFLIDIKMRWLTPRELASCQGFPKDYILIGSKEEQIKGIGNSIPPQFITAIMDSMGEANQHNLFNLN